MIHLRLIPLFLLNITVKINSSESHLLYVVLNASQLTWLPDEK